MAGWMQSWTALAVDHRAVVLDCLPQLLGTVGHRAHLGCCILRTCTGCCICMSASKHGAVYCCCVCCVPRLDG